MADIALSAVANVRPLIGSVTRPIMCAAVVIVGQVVIINSAGKAALADADDVDTAKVRGVVTAIGAYGKTTSVIGDMVDVTFLGPVAGWTGLTPGDDLFASVTAGAIADAYPAGSSSDFVWAVGFVLSSTVIFINPFTFDIAAQ